MFVASDFPLVNNVSNKHLLQCYIMLHPYKHLFHYVTFSFGWWWCPSISPGVDPKNVKFLMISKIKWVKQRHKRTIPPVITIFIGGMATIPSHGWSKWHCFTHITGLDELLIPDGCSLDPLLCSTFSLLAPRLLRSVGYCWISHPQ